MLVDKPIIMVTVISSAIKSEIFHFREFRLELRRMFQHFLCTVITQFDKYSVISIFIIQIIPHLAIHKHWSWLVSIKCLELVFQLMYHSIFRNVLIHLSGWPFIALFINELKLKFCSFLQNWIQRTKSLFRHGNFSKLFSIIQT